MVASKKKNSKTRIATALKCGDQVMVMAGGHKTKRPIQGKIGKLLRFVGDSGQRVVVEGVNMITRHERAKAGQAPRRVQKEGSVHISNVMFYAEKAKRPVRLKVKVLENGTKVRGYLDRTSKQFEQIDS